MLEYDLHVFALLVSFLDLKIKYIQSLKPFINHASFSSYHLFNLLLLPFYKSIQYLLHHLHHVIPSLTSQQTSSWPYPSTEKALWHYKTPKCQIQNHFSLIIPLDFSGEFATVFYLFLETLFSWLPFPNIPSSPTSSSVLIHKALPLPRMLFLTNLTFLLKRSLPILMAQLKCHFSVCSPPQPTLRFNLVICSSVFP